MPPLGLEPVVETHTNSLTGEQRGADSDAVDARNISFDAELGEVVSAWSELAEPLKNGILAMIRAAGK